MMHRVMAATDSVSKASPDARVTAAVAASFNTGQVPKQTSLRPVTRAEWLAVVADLLEAAVQQPDVAEVLQGAIERKRRADAERAAREERKRTNAAFRTLLSQVASRRGFAREFAMMGARAIQRHVTDARLLRTFVRLTGKGAAS